MQFLDLKRPILIRTGDYKRKWVDAKIIYVCIDDVGEDENGQPLKGLSFSVEFDGCTQRISDAFGWGSDDWQYKEKCCE